MTDDQNAPALPPVPPSAPLPPPPPSVPMPPPPPVTPTLGHRTRNRILIGVGAIVAAIVVALGVIGIVQEKHHAATDAEMSVQTFMQSNAETEADAQLVGGSVKGVKFDAQCRQVSALGVGTKFLITSSSRESDGSADVHLTIQNGPKMSFHLVHTSGSWLINAISCS